MPNKDLRRGATGFAGLSHEGVKSSPCRTFSARSAPSDRYGDTETIEEKRVRIKLRKRLLATPGASLWVPPRRRVTRPVRPKSKPLPELDAYDQRRLWEKVKCGPADECWPWKAAKAGPGYGRFKVAGKLYSPHRLIYALANGPICDVPEHHGSVVMHTCDNRLCCNPAHLALGRQVENVADMFRKGRAHQCVKAAAKGLPVPSLATSGRTGR